MTTPLHRLTDLPRIPVAVLGLTLVVVVIPRIVGVIAPGAPGPAIDGGRGGTTETETGARTGLPAADPLAPSDDDADLGRIRANIAFWGDRLAADPRDFVSATRLAGAEIERARATGDISAYVAADQAVDRALEANPDSAAALGLRGTVLVALHRFPDARAHANTILARSPDDPVALATLGDASLELGDLEAAGDAFRHLDAIAPSAAAKVRLGRLAFIEGRTADAVGLARAAVDDAIDEGALGSARAWYEAQLADLLLATGDRTGGAAAIERAIEADDRLPIALGLRARSAAADGRLDDAIGDLDRAVAAIPLPDLLARRADLYDLRGAAGDADRARDDRATVLAIADLDGPASGVYDRTLSLFLSTTRIDPARALRLAEAEIRVRRDVYGYDALGWALLANGRATEADQALTAALAAGTRDARLLFHAGMAANAVGDRDRARQLLSDALALDPTFDPRSVAEARATLGAD